MSKKRKQLHKQTASSDLPVDRERIAELRALGWSPRDAELLRVIEIALESVLDMPDPVRATLTGMVCVALARQPIRLAVAPLYAWPEHEDAWRALAASAVPPYDEVFAGIVLLSSDQGLDAAS